ncbi:MAG: type II toxin-antitoxin system VapC family toxin [Desulfotignum sp.]|jgi:PIN domain nuclease of toxin-antitoxin system|nr:type II toxin-antitoxin system VapC family toxin [Desulfotignum sp.]MCF8088473.1 type II toxin-antitoxin system VapC family toxin [Desulfotignum sp.]MCF8137285.1 type II toxin-antitoxin system VapC family toxin [Desulfotignum sp.]
MNLLLDTHILLWSLNGSDRLLPEMKNALEEPSNTLWLSPITIWEMLMLHEKDRIRIDHSDPVKWIRKVLNSIPFKEAPLNHEVAVQSRQVKLPHQDPADRFLVATALVYDLIFMTVDQKILDSDSREICF